MRGKVAMVSSSWHADLVNVAEVAFHDEMMRMGFDETNIVPIRVPGSLEIPLFGKIALEKQEYDAAVGIGLVVNGGIYRHEFVAQAVIDGIVRVSLETRKPFLSAVLTPIEFREGDEFHVNAFMRHMVIKGQELGKACLAALRARTEI